MKEIWKQAVGYEDRYEVSNKGRVKRTAPGPGAIAGKVLKLQPLKTGYLSVCLTSANYTIQRHRVHKLVAMAFLGDIPEGYEINHIDGNKQNNYTSNLEYVTRSENTLHAYRLGLMKSLLTESDIHEIRSLLERKEQTQREIAEMFSIHRVTVSKIARGIRRIRMENLA